MEDLLARGSRIALRLLKGSCIGDDRHGESLDVVAFGIENLSMLLGQDVIGFHLVHLCQFGVDKATIGEGGTQNAFLLTVSCGFVYASHGQVDAVEQRVVEVPNVAGAVVITPHVYVLFPAPVLVVIRRLIFGHVASHHVTNVHDAGIAEHEMVAGRRGNHCCGDAIEERLLRLGISL